MSYLFLSRPHSAYNMSSVINNEQQRIEESNQSGGKHNCPECEKQFTRKYNLNIHQKSAHMDIKYPCQECGQEFTRSGRKWCHLEREQSNGNIEPKAHWIRD